MGPFIFCVEGWWSYYYVGSKVMLGGSVLEVGWYGGYELQEWDHRWFHSRSLSYSFLTWDVSFRYT
jgi:hypothetical protein